MSLTRFCLRSVKNKVGVVKSLSATNNTICVFQQTRNYAFKSELKIKWVRPEKVSCIKPEKSGDLQKLPSVDLQQFPLEFQKSAELENADDLVKRKFSLEFTNRSRAVNLVRQNIVNTVKRHQYDWGSMEALIASMTGTIRNLQQHMESFPRDKVSKVRLKEMIDKRKKYLKHLRRWDYKRFEWLLVKLDLVFKPPPSEFKWVTRKDSLQKLTDKYCNDLREERLRTYRATLDEKKLDFLQHKLNTLLWIQEEEKSCGVPSTVTQEELNALEEQIKQRKTSNSKSVNEQ